MVRRFLSIRDVMKVLPPDGEIREAIRAFNLAPQIQGKARSVRDLAIKLGFDVLRVPNLGKMSGRLLKDPFAENGFLIEVNKNHSIQAQRWAVLHEIGHFFLHIVKDDPFADDMAFDASGETFYVNMNEEIEANSFAEAVLFGDGALKAANSKYGGNNKEIAHHFGVSEKVIQIARRRFC